jgi:hypothetical protein
MKRKRRNHKSGRAASPLNFENVFLKKAREPSETQAIRNPHKSAIGDKIYTVLKIIVLMRELGHLHIWTTLKELLENKVP